MLRANVMAPQYASSMPCLENAKQQDGWGLQWYRGRGEGRRGMGVCNFWYLQVLCPFGMEGFRSFSPLGPSSGIGVLLSLHPSLSECTGGLKMGGVCVWTEPP